jgi:AcrR family transcriptional regulator
MMNKEKQILEAAIKLFSEKGYPLTSIQDIASECGIAKGSIYSYFKSKEDLLVAALNYYFNKIMRRVNTLEKKHVNPRDKFATKLTVFFESVAAQKKLVDLQTYDQEITFNDTFKRFVLLKQYDIHQIYKEGLLSMYGDKIQPYLYDVTIMMEGMIRSYIRVFLLDNTNYDLKAVVEYVLNRVDDLVSGLVESGEQPIFSEIQIRHALKKIEKFMDTNTNKMKKVLGLIKSEIDQLPNGEEYLVSVDVIEEELSKEQPRVQVIQGMLSNLKEVATLDRYLKEMKALLASLR